MTGERGHVDNLLMLGCKFQRFVRVGRIAACAALIAGCTQVGNNNPINLPLTDAKAGDAPAGRDIQTYFDDMVVALSFSGGGTRAAAFSYGVLQGFDETRVQTAASTISLLDHIDFVSGVSGGSVLAAYYGLKKRAAMADFKEKFLLQNAQANLQMDLNFFNISKGLNGGVNDPTAFPKWLDANLYGGATFKSLLFERRPTVWINASDIYSRTPFVFDSGTFSALCSNLADYPISQAVAASAAVPVIFAPVVIQNFPGGCPTPLPDWVERVRSDPDAAPLIKTYADALERYHSGDVKYVKLLDGGIVDNYGLAAITVRRLASNTPYGPLEPEEAVKLRRFLFLVVDFRPCAFGRLGADHTWTVGGRSDHGSVRHRDAVRRGRHLFRFLQRDGRLARRSREVALPSYRGAAPPIRRDARLELQGREILCRPYRFRSIGAGARGGA